MGRTIFVHARTLGSFVLDKSIILLHTLNANFRGAKSAKHQREIAIDNKNIPPYMVFFKLNYIILVDAVIVLIAGLQFCH